MKQLGIIMLSREVVVAFRPQAKILALALAIDGTIIAWAEGDGLVCISHKPKDDSGEDLLFWKSKGKVTGLIISGQNLFVLDEYFGLTCLDFSGVVVWKTEISGGGFCFKEIMDRFAIIDSLGRLHYVLKDGRGVDLGQRYSSIIKIEVIGKYLILAHESGELRAILEESTYWERPSRGELGESITSIGSTSSGELIIGREGYALVPGDEEALELEIWNFEENKLLLRTDLNSRLTVSKYSEKAIICGFDDGEVKEIKRDSNGKYVDDMSTLMSCNYPIKTINYHSGQVICSAWFYIFGLNLDGSKWKVEHQGMPEFIEISHDGKICIFAGEDQNDWTEVEPIGSFSLINDLIEIDESELSSWFSQVNITPILDSEDLYGEGQNISEHLTEEELEKLNEKQFFNIDESIDELIDALDSKQKGSDSEELKGILTVDSDELISQLDDAIENMAMLPESAILDELNTSIQGIEIPIANAGDDQRISSQEDQTAIVTLDGSSSFDPQNRIKTWSWINQSGKEISDIPKLNVRLNIGNHRFELRICDIDGNWNSDNVSIIVE